MTGILLCFKIAGIGSFSWWWIIASAAIEALDDETITEEGALRALSLSERGSSYRFPSFKTHKGNLRI